MNRNRQTNKSFAIKCFNRLVGFTAVSYLVDLGISFMSSLVIANTISSSALAAMNVVSPIYSVVLFVSVILAEATSTSIQIELGNFNKDKAGVILARSLVFSLILGVLCFLAVQFGLDWFIEFLGVSGKTAAYARAYYRFTKLSYIFIPLYAVMEYYISDSSNIKMIVSVRIVTLFTNTILAYILSKKMGIDGVGLANVIGMIINVALMQIHFKTDYNAVKPKWMKMELEYIQGIKRAFPSAASQLIMALSSAFATKIIVSNFGSEADAVLTVWNILNNMILLESIYEAVSSTAKSQIDIYVVERNFVTTNKLIKHNMKTSIIAGLGLGLFYIITAPLVPSIFALSEPSLVAACVNSVRILGVFTVFKAVCIVFEVVHQAMMHYAFSTLIVLLRGGILYIITLLLTVKPFGMNGVWYSETAIAFETIPIVLLITYCIIKKNPNLEFPWLNDKTELQPEVFEIVNTEEAVIALRDKIQDFLAGKSVNNKALYRAQLIIEEFGMLIAQKNNGGEQVLSEWDIKVDERQISIIVRDDGKPLDFSDEDNSTASFGAYFLSCIIPESGQVNYATSVSMNRHRFQIEL